MNAAVCARDQSARRKAVNHVDQPADQRRGNLPRGDVTRHGCREAAGQEVPLPRIDKRVQPRRQGVRRIRQQAWGKVGRAQRADVGADRLLRDQAHEGTESHRQ